MMKQVDEILEIIGVDKDILTLPELLEIYKKLTTLDKLKRIIKTHLIASLEAGEKLDGYKLVRTRGRIHIVDVKSATERIYKHWLEGGKTIPISLLFTPTTLTTLNRSLGKDVVGTLLGDILSSEGKDLDLAPLDDDRPEITK